MLIGPNKFFIYFEQKDFR